MLVSPPEAVKVGLLPVAALEYVSSLTAELVAVTLNNSLPFVSKIDVPILGDVKVLFVRVAVELVETKRASPPVLGNVRVFVAVSECGAAIIVCP